MARRALQRGEFGETKLSGWHQGGWVKEAALKADRIKPDKWRATVLYQDGKAKRPRPLTVEDTSKEKAKTRIEARKEEEKGKVNSAPELGNRTVEEAATAYLEKLNAGKVRNTRTGEPASPSTVRTYRQVVTAYVLRPGSLIKGMKLSDVTAYDLGLEAEALIDDGKGSHLNHCKVVWTAIFSDAAKARAIPVNPVMSMSKTPVPRAAGRTHANGAAHDKNRELSPIESDQLRQKVYADDDAVRKGIADLILLGMSQGLRIAEAASLRWEDLDLDSGRPTLSVVGTLQPVKGEGIVWHDATKSAASTRTIPLLGPAVVAMLRQRRAERTYMPRHHDPKVQAIRDAYVFLSPKGRVANVDNINKDVRTALNEAGFPWATFHTFRHTLSVRMKTAGMPPIVAGRFLGHTEAVSMKNYSDSSSEPMAVLGVADQLALPSAGH